MRKDRSLPSKVMNNILLATALKNKAEVIDEVNPFEGVDESLDLVFEPVYEWSSCGNDYQRSKTSYKNVEIIYDVVNYWNILKKPSDTFTLQLILPMDTVLVNGWMWNYYAPEGFGSPNFRTLKDLIYFIDNNPELINNELVLG